MNTGHADAPLDAPSPEHDALETDAEAIAPPLPARAIWPGSPTPALTYPDPPVRPTRPATGA